MDLDDQAPPPPAPAAPAPAASSSSSSSSSSASLTDYAPAGLPEDLLFSLPILPLPPTFYTSLFSQAQLKRVVRCHSALSLISQGGKVCSLMHANLLLLGDFVYRKSGGNVYAEQYNGLIDIILLLIVDVLGHDDTGKRLKLPHQPLSELFRKDQIDALVNLALTHQGVFQVRSLSSPPFLSSSSPSQANAHLIAPRLPLYLADAANTLAAYRFLIETEEWVVRALFHAKCGVLDYNNPEPYASFLSSLPFFSSRSGSRRRVRSSTSTTRPSSVATGIACSLDSSPA